LGVEVGGYLGEEFEAEVGGLVEVVEVEQALE